MSLAGEGAVAIWNDIAPEARAEFYQWHGREHMPERAGVPGFLRGRRYAAVNAASPEYFTLYETVSASTLTGQEYLARLNHPTPWTVATTRHFHSVSRSLCTVAASLGEGQGGLIATLRYDVDDERAPAHRQRMAGEFLPQVAALPGVAGCHLLIADEIGSAIDTAEKKVRTEKILIPRWIALVESWGDVEPFDATCSELSRHPAFADARSAPVLGVYRLQNSRSAAP